MRRMAVCIVGMALLLGVAVGGAQALRSLALEPAGVVEARSSALTITGEGEAFFVVCEVTLTITLNRAIAKSVGSVVGGITAVTIANCRGGTVRVLAPEARRPWIVTQQAFTGTLPNIREAIWQYESVGWLLEAFFGIARCLFGGTLQVRSVGNPITELRVREGRMLPTVTNLGGVECPSSNTIRGTFRLNRSQRMTLL